MSTADEVIARVRKIDELTREKSIMRTLLNSMTQHRGRLGVREDFLVQGEQKFTAFPTTSTERFVKLAEARIVEIEADIERTRSELEPSTTDNTDCHADVSLNKPRFWSRFTRKEAQ